MKQKLVQGVKKILPEATTKRLESSYRRGRVRLMKMRYGNPADGARVIAVTGRTGKTTTAQLIMGLLVEAGHSVAVYDPAEHGNTINALWKGLHAAKAQKADFVIVEVSSEIAKSGALETLVLDTVVMTNTCPECKSVLAQAAQYAVLPDDHESGALAIAEHQIVSFGSSKEADVKIEDVKLFRKGTEISFVLDHHSTMNVATHLIGHANVTNVATAIATAYILGIPLSTVEEGVARLEVMPGNFEYVANDDLFMTVVDRAASEKSAELVINSAKELVKRRLIVALALKKKPHVAFLARIQQQTNRLIVVGNQDKLPSTVEAVASVDEARAIAERAAKKDDLVLLIGESFIIRD
jgi:UDP-N-acetylmuramyl pentapeptide synthase